MRFSWHRNRKVVFFPFFLGNRAAWSRNGKHFFRIYFYAVCNAREKYREAPPRWGKENRRGKIGKKVNKFMVQVHGSWHFLPFGRIFSSLANTQTYLILNDGIALDLRNIKYVSKYQMSKSQIMLHMLLWMRVSTGSLFIIGKLCTRHVECVI